jgi:centrosomal protein CEP120
LNLRNEQLSFAASLGGNILETNIIPSKTAQSDIGTKLIWETDRESIKRLKNNNCPIKLECFSSSQDLNRTLIGFNLILIRNIPILAVSKGSRIFKSSPLKLKLFQLNKN